MSNSKNQIAAKKIIEYVLLMSISIFTFFGFSLIVSVNNVELPLLLDKIPIINNITIPENTNPLITNEIVSFDQSDFNTTIASLNEQGLYYYEDLSLRMKSSFDLMYYGVLNNQTKIKFTEKLSVKELEKLVYILQFDCPTLFNLDLTYNYDEKSGNVVAFYPKYKMVSVEYKSRVAIIEEKTKTILQNIEGMSEYDAEIYIHDYILSNTVYDLETKDNDNIYGCLANGKANCKGYTSTFNYLLRKAGINSTSIIGEITTSDGNTTGHSWNLVKINGAYSYTDICWDDITQSQEYNDIEYHYAFFNMTYSEMIDNRNISKQLKYLGKIPEVEISDYSYYKKENLYATSYEEAKQIIKSKLPIALSSQEKYFVIQCSNKEEYDKLINNVTDIIKELINDEKIFISSCKYSKIDSGYTLIIHNFS